MKILQVNKFFYPKGGAETYFLSLINLLKNHGQEIFIFSQKNQLNQSSATEKYFLNNIDLDKFYFKNIFRLGRIFWSFSAARKITALIKEARPNIVHLHNVYHQISPSILPAIKKFNLPIVLTVHDFKLIKPDYTLWLDEKQKPQRSWLTHLLLKLEFTWHKHLDIYNKYVDIFIAPSNFVQEKLLAAGLPKEKIVVVPHFIDLNNYVTPTIRRDHSFISFGRLDASKGVDQLIRALAKSQTTLKLKIAGTGPEEIKLKKLVADLNLGSRVEFLGQLSKINLIPEIKKADFAVFPSLVHETFGLGIIESYVCGRPVIASRVGAFPEIITSQTGITFNPQNEAELIAAIETMSKTAANREQNCLETAQKYSAENHYQKIMSLYEQLVKNNV